MVNKILDEGNNCKWILYHLDNYISCNLHPLKKRTAKACIIELHKDDNIIQLTDGYYKVYAHLSNKAIRSLSTLESLEGKKHKYPVIHINNFQFEIKSSKFYKKYDSELNKTKYILMLETPEIELTGEYCKIKSKGTDVMKLDTVKELLENIYKKDEKKYNNYYKNINEEKAAESQESSNIPLSNPSISSSSKEMEEEEEKEEEEKEEEDDDDDDDDEGGNEEEEEKEEEDNNNEEEEEEEEEGGGGNDDEEEEKEEEDDDDDEGGNEEEEEKEEKEDDDDEEEEEEEEEGDNNEEIEEEEKKNEEEEEDIEEEKKNDEDDDEPVTQLSPVRKKNTIIARSPLPIKVINEKISNDISSIHTLPSSIISTHSSIWITNNNKNNNKNSSNITPSASYTILSILDKDDKNNTDNKTGEDNNERVINIDDILPRGPDIERTKRNEEKNLNKNKNKKIYNSVSKEKEKESENGFKFVENDIVDLIVDNKKLEIQFNNVLSLYGKSEKRKIDDEENELELFRQNYMRKMRRLVESRRK